MSNRLRPAHYTWLREPIKNSIDTTRLKLDVLLKRALALASPPAGAEPIWYENQKSQRDDALAVIATEINHIHSALVVVECHGGASLALEIKILVSVIKEGRIGDSLIQQVLVSILESLLTIPKYLEMLIDGAPDSAGILAKRINELRAARGVPLLEEDNLLPPDVEFVFVAPPLRDRECSPEFRNQVFARSAKRFQLAFSGFMTNQDRATLDDLKAILHDLQIVTDDLEVGCFWWLGECLVDALISGAIRSTGDTLSKLRMLSVAVQHLEMNGEEGARENLGVNRFKSLLSSLSMSSKLPGKVKEVLEVFNVRATTETPSLEHLRAKLEAADSAAFKDIVTEIRPMLEAAMVCLGIAIRSPDQPVFDNQMAQFRLTLRDIASVLYVVNESELAAVAAKALGRVDHITISVDFTEDLIEALKTDFMFLEKHIKGLGVGRGVKSLEIPGLDPSVLHAIISETIRELARTRRLVAGHLSSGAPADDLRSGLLGLMSAAAALEVTGLTQVSQVLSGVCQSFLSETDLTGLRASEAVALSARALVAVEGYLHTLDSGLEPSPKLLQKGAEALGSLGLRIEYIEPVTSSELLVKFEQARRHGDNSSDENHFLTELIELRRLLDVLLKQSTAEPGMLDQLYELSERLAMAAHQAEVGTLHRLPRALSGYCQHLKAQHTACHSDAVPADSKVGAAIELIIRCMDEFSARGKVAIFTKDMEDALHEQWRTAHEPKSSEFQPIATDVEPQVAVVGELILSSDEIEARECPPEFDAGLIEIFREEFQANLIVLEEFCLQDGGGITRDVCRAAHTIHGISGSAECPVIQKVYGALEGSLETLHADQVLLKPVHRTDLLDLLRSTAAFVKEFPWETETPRQTEWVNAAATLGSDAEEAEFTEITAASTNRDTTAETSLAAPEPTGEIIPHAKSFAPELPVATPQPGNSVAREYNDQYDLYLEEASDRMHDFEKQVAAWATDMSDKDLVVSIKRHLHTLKGAAAMVEAQAITDLTHVMEDLFESITCKLIAPSLDCARLVDIGVNTLKSMTEVMRIGAAYERPSSLIACFEQCVNTNNIDLRLLEAPEVLCPSSAPERPLAENGRSFTEPGSINEGDVKPSQDGQLLAHSADQGQPENTAAKSTKRRRGGRGKGGLKKHVDDEAITQGKQLQGEPEELETEPPFRQPEQPELSDKPQPTLEVVERNAQQVIPEKIPHAESSADIPLLNLESNYVEELQPQHQPSAEIQSTAARAIIAQASNDQPRQTPKASGGTSEKVRVDLLLLESAAQQASELIALRARLNALHDEANLRLTAARALLEGNSLQHGQFTNALRSYANSQPQALNDEHTNLERFNGLSSMHVAMGAQIDEVLAEVNEVFVYMQQMRRALSELQPALTGLQRDLLHSRLVPFSNIRMKLLNAVSQTAAATKKNAAADLAGTHVIMDKMMLDAIADPLTHILRNAVDHGIEAPADRAQLGKPEQGAINISVTRRAKQVLIVISDDGRGIDVEAVRTKAVAMNLITSDEKFSASDALRLITRSGFSTAQKVTQVSGRGVGMDIVATTVEQLGGRLHIESVLGEGTTFTIELPFTIGSNKAIIASSGTQWFAIPSYTISQVLLVPHATLESSRAQKGYASVLHEDREYEVVHLADLVAMPNSKGAVNKRDEVALILCEQGEDRIAIEVSDVDSMPEIHIRKLKGMLANTRGLVGETEMQDGSPVFVLDVMEAARINLKRTESGYRVRQNRVRSVRREDKPTVLVVDDSRVYRTELERIFTSFGYRVTTAVDGQAALRKLSQSDKPDLMLVDVEMPVMTGFEFTEAIRAMPNYDDTPIIMITTRTGLEDKALRAGVNKYLLKPCDADQLRDAANEVSGTTVRRGSVA